MRVNISKLLETALDALVNLGQLLLGRLCARPADAETLLLVWLGDDMDCFDVRQDVTKASTSAWPVISPRRHRRYLQ